MGWLGAERVQPPLARVEAAVKGLLFDCRMCGRCALSASGMSCPMNCPKGVRNGPCGGVRADGTCELRSEMSCVWVESWRGSLLMSEGRLPVRLVPAVEHNEAGASSWLRVMRGETAQGLAPTPRATSSDGRFDALLNSGAFVVTSELSPPDSADPEDLHQAAAVFSGAVDALNVTDGAGANCHLSSLAGCTLLLRSGCEPIMQMTCRDRNRIAIQSDILGAAALGVTNLLCLTGDGVEHGDHPGAKPVFDLDAVSLLDTARTLCDEGRYLSGRRLRSAPRLLLGAADNPFAPPFDARPLRLAKKIAVGARFVQTQYCFDVPLLARYMQRVRDEGLHERCFILVGVGPLVSLKAAHWLRRRVPGVHIPDALMARLQSAADPLREGIRICVEMVQQLREIPGVAGVHVMAHRHHDLVAQVVAGSGVLAGRTALFAGRSTAGVTR
ncbi:MAG: methylenetetrahydrofolate reductase C-terminal domain-containing protein [Burkholderiales bacterium]|nr:methylenetetrahydrofolate reductase C-terminal domain-containing protein [Burkholderiales bacterium]